MKKFVPVALFFLCNAVGFSIGPAVYALALSQNAIDIEASGFNLNSMQQGMGVVLLAWAVCAVFSFASFFLSKKWKIVFLSMPIIAPLLFSFLQLLAYFG